MTDLDNAVKQFLVESHENLGQFGADGYLTKPFTRRTIPDDFCRLRSAET